MKRIAVMLLAVALMTGAASADTLVFSGAVYDAFITDPVPVGDGSESLLGFTLYFVNTSGDTGKAFDTFDDVSDVAFTGISSGPLAEAMGKGLHQQDSLAFGSYSPTASNANYSTAIDSHFLSQDGDLLTVQAPNETRVVNVSTEPSDALAPFDAFADTSFGDHLGGAFADSTAAGVSPRLLAYLVVADPGGPLGLVAYGSALSVVDNFYQGSGPSGGEIMQFGIGVVPEPATMSLLAIGGIAALIRRRK